MPRVKHPGRVAIVSVVGLACATLLAVAIHSADTRTDSRALPAAIQSVSPSPGSDVPPQQPIAIDLQNELTGDITVCPPSSPCAPIPADQVDFVKGLGQLTFTPGPGKDIQRYAPGLNKVTIDYRNQGDPNANTGSYTWSFTVTA
ncbi:MAG TPA: hypothetical protein VIC35_05435 [Acidimicrobiia bacterium]